MTLIHWMQTNAMTAADVSRATMATQQSVRNWLSGDCPGPRFMRKLRKLTKNQVQEADFPRRRGKSVTAAALVGTDPV